MGRGRLNFEHLRQKNKWISYFTLQEQPAAENFFLKSYSYMITSYGIAFSFDLDFHHEKFAQVMEFSRLPKPKS